MEKYFEQFRKHIIGNNLSFNSPYGKQHMLYADWIASGRLYAPIEKQMQNVFGPWVANTHTEASESGTMMTKSYHYAHELIKAHVNAGENDVIITYGHGMTTVINKFQRLLGLKMQKTDATERAVVFVTHMEHHSNQTSWMATNADVVVLQPDQNLMVDAQELERQLLKYKDRKFKIGSFTACSNVTGVHTDYYQLAEIMHQHGGLCFVDFAANAPYESIDMHPKNRPLAALDAIFFSPHKFLGGPGSTGVIVFNRKLYHNTVPDNPWGGTVDWTNPWGEHKYIDDIEIREDGGTPGFLQTIRAALAIELKNQMGVENIHKREKELVALAFQLLTPIKGLHIMLPHQQNRLGIISFYIEGIHYNLVVKLLNDRFGIQMRGGCACAGTYGHFLMDIDRETSRHITDLINSGDLSAKPGWVRLSLHPTMSNNELEEVAKALQQIADNYKDWGKDYTYDPNTNEFRHKNEIQDKTEIVKEWFTL